MTIRAIAISITWILALVMFALIPSDYMPHAACWRYDVPLISGMMGSNLAIASSYGVISMILWRIDQTARLHNKHFLFAGFALFIFFCGLTHVSDIITIWYPLFWLDVGLRWMCAIPSILVAVYLFTKRQIILRIVEYVRQNWAEVTRDLLLDPEPSEGTNC